MTHSDFSITGTPAGQVQGLPDGEQYASAIRHEQTELVFTQAPVALLAALAVAVLVTAGLWHVTAHQPLLVWLGIQFAQTALRALLVLLYRRASPVSRSVNPRWAQWYLAGVLVSGVTWGCLGLFIDFTLPIEYQFLILLGFTGVLGGAIFSYAASMPVYIGFLFPAIIIPFQSLLVQATQAANAIGFMLIVYAGALLLIAYNYNRNIYQSLLLRHENTGLVRHMSVTNASLENEIRERQQAENELSGERRLFTNGPVTVFRWCAAKGWPIAYVSKTVTQFGFDDDELVNKQSLFADMILKSDLKRVEQAKTSVPEGRHVTAGIDYRIIRNDGEIRWVYDYTIPVRDKNGKITHYAGYLLDITDRKQAEIDLLHEKERAQVTLHSIVDAVITTDANGQVEYLNQAAEKLTGWDSDNAHGLPLSRVFSLFDDESRSSIVEPALQSLKSGKSLTSAYDHILGRNDGSHLSIQYSISPIMSTHDAPFGVVLVFHDVTENRSMARQISYQAAHDQLTGLINRAEFEIRLEYALESARSENAHHALFFLDLDQFKLVNDTCSHAAGDALLRDIAGLLKASLRDSDIIARVGGDEFGVLLKNCSLQKAEEIAGNMLSLIKTTRFESGGSTIETSASIGISMIDSGSASVTEVMKAADLACYAAKDTGRSTIHIFHSSDTELARRHEEMQWVSRLKEAINDDRLLLHYQDIVPVTQGTGARRHFEVLVRMRDEEGGLIKPNLFLSAAENYDMITAVDRWVVEHSFSWYSGRKERLLMSINLSGKSVTDPAFLEFIINKLAEYRIKAEDICFEITETAAIAKLDLAASFMHELHKLGCRFALDDFGSGLSSFAYLRSLPVNYLKIDGSFVRNMDTDQVNAAMVNAINQLGVVIGIETIAEFVENDDIMQKLADIGVDYAQGHGVSLPKPLEDMEGEMHQTA
ncbi:MAG: EAL domain-containing protein [Gammaproteobacteria bacterium]|nr:MAG: EAL domain-containing protein [Gammaproteobacteria bacterium]